MLGWLLPLLFGKRGGTTTIGPGGTFRRTRYTSRLFRRQSATRTFRRTRYTARTFRRRYFAMSVTIQRDILPKDVQEVIDYQFDFSRCPERLAGQTISSVSVPSVSGLTIGTPAVTTVETDGVEAGSGAVVRISGGTANATYDLECRATFSGGSVRVVYGRIQMEAQ